MIIGKETGIGPALRVLRHLTERQRFYQIKFGSGERAVVMVAGMPLPSVEVVRLSFNGLIPWQTVWEYNPRRAGGYSNYLHKLQAMFSSTNEGADDAFGYIHDTLLRCPSIKEARMLLLERERLADRSTPEAVVDFPSREPKSVTSDDHWELGIVSPLAESSSKPNEVSATPNRYRITQHGKGRLLTCTEAPMVALRAERGTAISAKQARNYPGGTIFLDGAAQGGPFVDIENDIYNLDHQQGCIRSLATCEQAMLLIRKALDLRKRDWEVLANDADLDTVFALWVFFNHLRLNKEPEVRAQIMPLLRLEGVIDAHGLDAQELAAFPPDLFHSTSAVLKQLRQPEVALKHNGRWSEIDLLEYIADRLRAVDELVYAPESFEGLHEIDELARAEIANGFVAVACRSDAGMIEVERQLRNVYGQRLGILIFQNAPASYRVRQADRTLPATLERAYERLNLLDPAVKSRSQNRWGGSPDFGGSPRDTGTQLMPTQIVEAVRRAFREPTSIDVASEIPRAAFLTIAALLPTLVLIFAGNLLYGHGYIARETVLLSAAVLTIFAGILFALKAVQVPGLYGWRVPMGFGWLTTLPAALIGAVAGGVWSPGSFGYQVGFHDLNAFSAFAALFLPVGAELLFRGVILGNLAARLPIQQSSGPLRRSWPTLISSSLYSAASLLLFVSFSNGAVELGQWFITAAAAVTFGIASGVARERSESIIASVLLHWVGAAALMLFQSFLS